MKELANTIQKILDKELRNHSNFDAVDIVPIPMSGDRMVRMRTLEEVLEEFNNSGPEESTSYLVQVKTRREIPKSEAKIEFDSAKPNMESIYLPNGKLNHGYLVRNAEILYAAGEYSLARNVYKALLQSGEKTPSALMGIGQCFESEGRLEEAKAHYEESIAYHPQLEAYQRLATILIQQKKDQQAAEVLERALNLRELASQSRRELLKAIGNCWNRAEKPELSMKSYQKALEIDPTSDELKTNLGSIYLQSGKIDDARRCFQDALASNPRSDKALMGLGSCALSEGNKREAHDCFARSLESNLNNPTAIYYLVKSAYEIKSYATAARLVENYIEIAPVNASLLYSLAGLQYHLGRMNESDATCRKILSLQPSHNGAQELSNLIRKYAESTTQL